MALIIWELEKAFRADEDAEADAPVLPGTHALIRGGADTPAALPVRHCYHLCSDLGLPHVLIVGGSACGKTTMLLEVISPTLEAHFPLFWTGAWHHTTSSRRGHHPTGELP